jgi:pectate lyase
MTIFSPKNLCTYTKNTNFAHTKTKSANYNYNHHMKISTHLITLRNLFFTFALLTISATQSSAAVTINQAGGWLETAWVEWTNLSGAQAYNVYVSPAGQNSWTKLDYELVRNYGTYGRADAVGLKAGIYQLKVVPVNGKGEMTSEASITDNLEVRAHNRQGYAHYNRPTSGWLEGVGAYKNDGTLKDNAIVLYVTSKNAKTITVTWSKTSTSGKESEVTYTGIQDILDGYRKCTYSGALQRPLCIRVVGTIKNGDTDKFLSSQGLMVKAEAAATELPLTIEGIGKDATFYNFGMQVSNCVGTEIRNLGIMLCLDDGIEISRENSHVWVHNMDMFYGEGGSGDKVKGDGAIDTKASTFCTISDNHYFDCGKCCLVDAKAALEDNEVIDYADNLTYCGNWFDHADQRLPRLRHGHAFHIYNNYYDGNGLYGVGLASASCAFVENNWFRNCRYPIVSSAQGSDLWHVADLKAQGTKSKGVMSGEAGGVCKAYNNHIEGAKSYFNQNSNSTYGLDAYEVSSRSEKVPSNITATNGGSTYSNFDTNGELYDCTPVATENVVAYVTGQYGAGRCQKGDFSWEFDDATEDSNKEVIPELKSALQAYKSTFVGFYSQPTAIKNVNANSLSARDGWGESFNLAGQQVPAGYKGLVISSGKKIIR